MHLTKIEKIYISKVMKYGAVIKITFKEKNIKVEKTKNVHLYFSQKQLLREMEPRLVILECAGYIFWQLFLWRL